MVTKIVPPSPRSEEPLHSPAASDQTISLNRVELQPTAKRLTNILFLKYMTVKLIQNETDTILVTHLVDKQRIFVGRSDPELKQTLDIDLLSYGGRERGVSRLHVTLRRMGNLLAIVDLNSTNGTFCNSVRLLPGQMHFLLNGDEVCFGKMLFQIHFGYNL
jgi:hypothetical protein